MQISHSSKEMEEKYDVRLKGDPMSHFLRANGWNFNKWSDVQNKRIFHCQMSNMRIYESIKVMITILSRVSLEFGKVL